MRLVFMGTPEIAVRALEGLVGAGHVVAAVFTQPDKPVGRKQVLVAPPIKNAAERLGIPVFQPSKIRTEETRELFASQEADVAVVFAYGRILPPALLETPTRGCINIHASLLPAYRGAAPIQWAIARGESVTGVTTMQMDEGLDTGAMLLSRSTPIGPDETAIEVAERLSALGADAIVETLARLDDIVPIPQDDERASFAPILRREDGLIDWASDATTIVNRCRGFQPWPGVWTTLGGARLSIWRAEVGAARAGVEPGTLVDATGDAITVACASGSTLVARELQLEGKRRMSAKELLNGVRLAAGTRLGTA